MSLIMTKSSAHRVLKLTYKIFSIFTHLNCSFFILSCTRIIIFLIKLFTWFFWKSFRMSRINNCCTRRFMFRKKYNTSLSYCFYFFIGSMSSINFYIINNNKKFRNFYKCNLQLYSSNVLHM